MTPPPTSGSDPAVSGWILQSFPANVTSYKSRLRDSTFYHDDDGRKMVAERAGVRAPAISMEMAD